MADKLDSTAFIFDATAETFQASVVERSRELPVLVDFWADWCQPCKLLSPVLEKVVGEQQGRVVLAKVNVEQAPDIAGSFAVQSIPAVYALRNGDIVDYFVGVLPEGQLRAWVERLLPTPAEALAAEAQKLAANDSAAAEAKYREAIAADPKLDQAKIGLAGVLVAQGRADEARAILTELEQRGFLEPEAEKLKAQLAVESHGQHAGNLETVRAAVVAEPENLERQFALAEALAAAGQYEEALQIALNLIQADRTRFLEPSRTLMLDIFQLLSADSELTQKYRRQLSLAMY